MKFLRQTPFLRPLLFLIAGIVIQSRWNMPVSLMVTFFVLAALFFVFSYIPKFNNDDAFRFLFGCGLGFLVFGTAVFLTKTAWEKSEWNAPAAAYWYQAVVVDDPVKKPKTWMYRVKIITAEKAIYSDAVDRQAVVYFPQSTMSHKIVPGDCLLFYGQLQSSPGYLKKQSFAASGFIRENDWTLITDCSPPTSLRIRALLARQNLLQYLHPIVPEQSSYALAAALMWGYRNDLDSDLQQSFVRIGAAHILAISGSHFAILFGMIYFMLSFIGNSPKGKLLKQLILLPMIWGFAYLTGLSPSVVRAALMLSIWGVGDAFFYRSFTLNTVAVAAFFMLLFNPLCLYDVGFQLSFLSVVSIVVVNPYLVKLYRSKNLIINYLWNLCSVSISAQVGVLPLSLYYFHQFPLVFLLTNIFLIPLSAVLLFLIPFSMLFHFLFGDISPLWFPLNQTLHFFISIAQALDNFPLATVSIAPDAWETLACFIAIVLIILLLIKKRVVYLYLLLILLAGQLIVSL